MKRLITLMAFGLLTFNVASAQTFTSIATDAMNDGSAPNLLDGTELEYSYDAVSDSIIFKTTVTNLSPNLSAFGVNIMVNIPGGGSTFNFWGSNNMNPFHRLLTVWVTGTPPSSYTGTIGISDAAGVTATNYASLSSNNISIVAGANTIILRVKRSDLIPDSYFTTNTITCATAGAVGSNQVWNDDIYSPNGTMTITKNFPSSTTDLKAKAAFAFSIYPNPSSGIVNIDLDKELTEVHANVYNCYGQKVISKDFSGTTTQLDVSSLSDGIYFLSINKGDEIVTKQLIVQ